MDYSDELLSTIFRRTRVVACIGFSLKPERASHYVSKFLQERGYRVIPVNPGHAGEEALGERIYPDLQSIPDAANVDFVDIFRRSEAVHGIVEDALAHLPALQTIWMQLGVEHAEAAAKAEAAGVTVIQDLCPKMVYPRLFGQRAVGELAD